jgi:hypothetical protein
VRGPDPEAAKEAIGQLPTGKRYVWQGSPALQWAFADFDSLSVRADKETPRA